jgi:YidC/Oxa1 family membrane protein insertase
MTSLYIANVFQPLIDVADWLITILHDDVGLSWGWSIVGLTVIVRLLIVPLTIKQIRSMNALRVLQPRIKEIQAKYKEDRQRMQQEMMRFYKENKVNPFASCLPLLLQLPVFMALFFLLNGDDFKDQVRATGQNGFLFIDDITEPATGGVLVVLMVLFIGSQMASTLVMSVTADKTQQRIMLLLPLVFAALVPSFPAGLLVYWITTNLWTLAQSLVVRRISPPPPGVSGPPGVPAGTQPAAALVNGGGTAGPRRPPPPPPRRKKRRRR